MSWVPLAGGGADLERQVAVRGSRSVHLTSRERDLVAYLAAHPGRTVTRAELLVNVWGVSERGSEEPIYSAIKRLRAKIDDGEHQHVVSVHGDGYRWVSPREPTTVAAPPSSGAAPPTDRFFGRHSERATIEEALGGARALLTLVGPGGAGKTRLATEIAAGRPHVFCDLSGATDEASAIAAIASALTLPLAGAEPSAWARGIGRALGAMPAQLLVFDNVEQIATPMASLLSGWSATLPPTLVTSREALRVRGERVVPVGPLPTAEALALFDDRVVAAGGGEPALEGERGAAPGERDRREAIVARLDRLPLAIELAASLAPQLGSKALLASLDDSLGTLVIGARDAPPRHATLRAAVQWSWSFLSEGERCALSELAVFVGPFELEDARAVLAERDASGLVAALARRSQIRREGERYQLYTAVRELAMERGSERSSAEARHAALLVGRGTSSAALLEGPRHREGAERLERDLPDLRAAFERSIDRDARLAAELALAVDAASGLRSGDVALRTTTLQRARRGLDEADPELRSALLLAEGSMAGASLDLLEEALALSTSPRRRAEIGLVWGERLAPRDAAQARTILERAMQDADAAVDDRTRGRVAALLGEIAWLEGAVVEARAHLRAGLAIHERAGDRRAIARTAAHLAHLGRLESGDGSAAALLALAARSAEELGDPLVSARVALDRGQHLTRIGDQRRAREALEEAARHYERIGFVRERAFVHLHLTETLVGLGELDRALEEAQRALQGLEPGDVAESTVHEAIACVHLLAGRLPEAETWIESGLALAVERGAARSECTLRGKRGLLRLVRGDAQRAWEDFDLAVKKNEARGSTAITGASLADRGMASLAAGRDDEARADFARARSLLRNPAPDRVDGRMLVVCEAAGSAFAAVARGESPVEVQRRLRAATSDYFQRVPPSEWDLVLRFLDWLVGRVGALTGTRRPALAVRTRVSRTPRRAR